MSELMWLFLSPFLAALVISAMGRVTEKTKKTMAVCLSAIPLFLLLSFAGEGWIGKEVDYHWIPLLDITFHLKVDSLSLPFLYLTAIISPIALLAVGTHPF